ncbi:MAG TPA: sugar kinase [Pseudonocardiaceae bacterium]|jgi:2-dehydro-3-deoxygluconokinase|nr:sugar kinase [Pseudonocardiaceae bacterium]
MGVRVNVDVLTAGEALAALRSTGPVRLANQLGLSVAGAEVNVAIGLARLGHAARWCGVLGEDQFGSLVLRTLRAEGVDVGTVRRMAAPTGIIVFEPLAAGVTRVDYHRAGSAGSQLGAADVLAACQPRPRILHVTGITPALGEGPASAIREVVATAHAERVTVCLDVNHRSRLWSAEQARTTLGDLVSYVDIVVASDDELTLLTPPELDTEQAQVDWLTEQGVGQIVVKRGAAGASAYLVGESVVHQAARTVVAVDTVGAGDAFVAGYLSGLLDSLPVEQRLLRAVTVAGFAVSTVGDWAGLPTRDELALLDAAPGSAVR